MVHNAFLIQVPRLLLGAHTRRCTQQVQRGERGEGEGERRSTLPGAWAPRAPAAM